MCVLAISTNAWPLHTEMWLYHPRQFRPPCHPHLLTHFGQKVGPWRERNDVEMASNMQNKRWRRFIKFGRVAFEQQFEALGERIECTKRATQLKPVNYDHILLFSLLICIHSCLELGWKRLIVHCFQLTWMVEKKEIEVSNVQHFIREIENHKRWDVRYRMAMI